MRHCLENVSELIICACIDYCLVKKRIEESPLQKQNNSENFVTKYVFSCFPQVQTLVFKFAAICE